MSRPFSLKRAMPAMKATVPAPWDKPVVSRSKKTSRLPGNRQPPSRTNVESSSRSRGKSSGKKDENRSRPPMPVTSVSRSNTYGRVGVQPGSGTAVARGKPSARAVSAAALVKASARGVTAASPVKADSFPCILPSLMRASRSERRETAISVRPRGKNRWRLRQTASA